jgi:dipeptidyl aminopeptidase/acylaminoacyl peptidase
MKQADRVGGTSSAALAAAAGGLTIERIVSIDSPREVRLHPRDRLAVLTAEAGGARQLFTVSLRTGARTQVTGSEKDVSDPQWSPDGRRLAYVRGEEIRIVDLDGNRDVLVTGHPAGVSLPRWSPDGLRIAFVSRRRGWSQAWIVDAPVPRRGRPAKEPRPPEPRPLTATGFDVEDLEWSTDGSELAVVTFRAPDHAVAEIHLLDIASGEERRVAGGRREWAAGPRAVVGGGFLYLSDADGWFQVVRLTANGRDRTVLTSGSREHGEPSGGYGYAPLPSPDGSRFAHIDVHDGLVDLVVTPIGGGPPVKRGRGRPPKNPPPVVAAGAAGPSKIVNPGPGVWRAVGWTADGAWLAAIGESETQPQDLWLLPVPDAAPAGSRARQITEAMPAVLAAAFSPDRTIAGERIAFKARDGKRIEGTLWRPTAATGKRGSRRVPTVVYPHGGPTWQAYRSWVPFKQLLVREGFAFLDIDFRGSTGYGRDFRNANKGEWGHADAFDMIDGARWAIGQPWSDGQLAIYGGSYGGYLVLCALVEEPGLWRAGVDLYGDSEIAESFRHGDRPGRLDLGRQMGSPEDPALAEVYRRGSPVYRAERIEAPILILHGRKDRRVVPLMTEKMVEALEIEGKHHEVHWYDDEGHGWEKRENKRDAFNRIRSFLRRHVLDETEPGPAEPAQAHRAGNGGQGERR